jgi:hypothetical protein
MIKLSLCICWWLVFLYNIVHGHRTHCTGVLVTGSYLWYALCWFRYTAGCLNCASNSLSLVLQSSCSNFSLRYALREINTYSLFYIDENSKQLPLVFFQKFPSVRVNQTACAECNYTTDCTAFRFFILPLFIVKVVFKAILYFILQFIKFILR